jgi:hypothetical protein
MMDVIGMGWFAGTRIFRKSGFSSDFQGFPVGVPHSKTFFFLMAPRLILSTLKYNKTKSLKTASTFHKTLKILLFFEFLLFYVHDDVTIRKISGFFLLRPFSSLVCRSPRFVPLPSSSFGIA